MDTLSTLLSPQPLERLNENSWTLGPYTQGALRFSASSPRFSITLHATTKDSLRISLADKAAWLEQADSLSFELRWNLDASLVSVWQADELRFEQVLNFSDDLGVAALSIDTVSEVGSVTLVRGSLEPDPADMVLAYWGNSLPPDEGLVKQPWNAQLHAQLHGQGVFLRSVGTISPIVTGEAPLVSQLVETIGGLLARQPLFVIIAAGVPDQRSRGPADDVPTLPIPVFRGHIQEALTKITASGAQAIVLIPPPLPAGASKQLQDRRAAYNMELRILAVNAGAPVVDLSDRFQELGPDASTLQDAEGRLSQAGHTLVASELATLLQYFAQYGR